MSDEHAPTQTPATADATSPRRTRVAIERVRQEDASPEAIHQAVRQALHATAAFDEAVRAGRRVFLKVNLVTNASRDEGICTDPEVVRAVIEEVLARGATPIVGDNPAVASTKSVLKSSGIGAVVESFGLEVPSLSETATLRCARAERFNAFEVSRAILDADVLINLPKLKTHSLTYMSMAMKNLFGLIPGTRKARWHVRAPHADLMATLFADLYSGVVDHFTAQGRGLIHLCDGVIALEGDGPGHGGKARFLGAILASSDGVALDRVGVDIAGLDFKRLTTLQMAGYAAADKAGTVEESETAPSARWVEVVADKEGELSLKPDLTDGKVYMEEYVNYLIAKLGDSQNGGVQAYSLDNEPALWQHTHSRIHPNPTGAKELIDKSVATAKVVKALDPAAEVYGPALYGFTAFENLADENDPDWKAAKEANGYRWYLDYYLEEMRKASEAEGVRLLDVLDIHYYSESARVGFDDRLQSVRTLYEKGFRENSWIGQWRQHNLPLLPLVQESIQKYYPGTKLAITEYNYGGEDVSATIAQAETLGCFADNGVYSAFIWAATSGSTMASTSTPTLTARAARSAIPSCPPRPPTTASAWPTPPSTAPTPPA